MADFELQFFPKNFYVTFVLKYFNFRRVCFSFIHAKENRSSNFVNQKHQFESEKYSHSTSILSMLRETFAFIVMYTCITKNLLYYKKDWKTKVAIKTKRKEINIAYLNTTR